MMFFTPSLPKELTDGYPLPPFREMETGTEETHQKTVSLSETVFTKNRVVRYGDAGIYMLLLYEVIEKEMRHYGGIGSSIGGKGGWGHHVAN